jgi:heme/copper-type cytochrome/quinol oxidase subunit 2
VTGELVLPCGVDVLVKAYSADVIHTLGNLHGTFQLDAIPDVNSDALLATPASPTSGTLRCTTLCGSHHKDHHAPFRFVSDLNYESWLNTQMKAASAIPQPTPVPSAK